MDFPTTADLVLFLKSNQWLISTFCLVFITGVIYLIARSLLNRLLKKAHKTVNFYDETFIEALTRPLLIAIWFVGICNAGLIVTEANPETSLLQFIPTIKKLGFLTLCAWFALRFIKLFEKNYIQQAKKNKKKVDQTVVHAITLLLTISTFVTTVLAAMQVFGMPISGLLAFGGIGGASIAFASKDLVANFFGGLVIYLDAPFKIGDWIRSPEKNIEGTVERIGWRATCIRTFDKRVLYVPNGIFLTICVENPSRMTHRRINTTLGIRYDDAKQVTPIIEDIKAMLKTHPEIDATQTLLVNLVNYGPSSLDIMIYTFTKTTDWAKFQDVQQDVLKQILDVVANHGAECAFPTQTLHIAEPEKAGLTKG